MKEKNTAVIIGEGVVPIEQIIRVAYGEADVVISSNPSFRNRMEQSKKMLHQAMDNCIPVYGVTTGYGKSCGKRLAREVALKNGEHLLRFHGCGTGTPINIAAVRSAMMSRLLCLSRGYSGVSMGLLDQIAAFLNKNITPVIPCEGSVGASGDLTPMSYVAAALTGERDVFYNGKRIPAGMAIEEAGLTK
jgi:histidine ammonia-lyase